MMRNGSKQQEQDAGIDNKNKRADIGSRMGGRSRWQGQWVGEVARARGRCRQQEYPGRYRWWQ